MEEGGGARRKCEEVETRGRVLVEGGVRGSSVQGRKEGEGKGGGRREMREEVTLPMSTGHKLQDVIEGMACEQDNDWVQR